jgi:class 3 adenylate cyclase/tetratricopeptide (TPR) repeat protein
MNKPKDIASERKYVTVLFSDISGYSHLTDRLDPEDVLNISNHVFRMAGKIVRDYDGYIERVVGDEILVFFGVPETHEDAAVRAIRAAMDIHRQVKQLDTPVVRLSGHPIRIHSGISSGLVVTGETDIDLGKDGFAGKPINIACCLKNLSGPDEILVAHDTYCKTEGLFDFDPLGMQKLKSQLKPIAAYKVLAAKNMPLKARRITGLRSDLIGRRQEIRKLHEAADNLKPAPKKIFCIVGDAGMGKSRLLQEFKSELNPSKFNWIESHAYAYRQGVSYFAFMDLLSRVMGIEETDSADTVRVKLQAEINELIDGDETVSTYIAILYGLDVEAAESLTPEFIKSKIEASVQKIFMALADRGPTIFCFEDIHWADKSSVALLQKIALSISQPALFICTQRPPLTLLGEHRRDRSQNPISIIKLEGLSPQDVQSMLQSLLKTENIPADLNNFISPRAEGNPLYLEEIVNFLVECGLLARSKGAWKTIGSIEQSGLPATIHGIIAERFDKLEVAVKTIMQEAAVIGKTFSPMLLEKISNHKDSIDYALKILQQCDFIQPRQSFTGLEFTLKHTLTHEVIYDSMLRKTRKALHEQIGRVLETLYYERKNEFCETLAYHFTRAESVYKAVDYHLLSGARAAKKFALQEADRHYEQAFHILEIKSEKSALDLQLLADVLNQWGHVFYLLGNNRKFIELFKRNEKSVASTVDKGRQAMFYSWLGLACRERERLEEAQRYLTKAINLGEEGRNPRAVGLATAWLAFTLADLGQLEAAIAHGQRALAISQQLDSQTLFRESMYGLAKGHLCRGEWKKTLKAGKDLVAYGHEKSDSRALAGGYLFTGAAYIATGDLEAAIDALQCSIDVAPGPTYLLYAKTFLGHCLVLAGKLSEAQKLLDEIISFGEKYGLEAAAEAAKALSGLIMALNGQLAKGLRRMADATQNWRTIGNKYRYTTGELTLGKIYQQLIESQKSANFLHLVKNLYIIIAIMPFARKRAELHFSNAAQLAKEMDARMLLGQAYLGLGELAGSGDDKISGRQYVLKAIQVFEQCEAENLLRQAKDALKTQG